MNGITYCSFCGKDITGVGDCSCQKSTQHKQKFVIPKDAEWKSDAPAFNPVPQDSLWTREEEEVVAKALGRKDDSGKIRHELIDVEFIEELSEVLTVGAQKYADNNWKNVKPFEDRYFAALLRHLFAWRKSQQEARDEETGLPHLAHAACCLMFLRWKERENANS